MEKQQFPHPKVFMAHFFRYRSSSVFMVFVGLVVLFSFFSHRRFISGGNLQILLALGSEFNIVVVGVGILMIYGEFVLSNCWVDYSGGRSYPRLAEWLDNSEGTDSFLYRYSGDNDALEGDDSSPISGFFEAF